MADSVECVLAKWQGGVHYAVNDGVWYQGSVYICLVANTSILPTNRDTWQLLVAGTEETGNPFTEKSFGFRTSAQTTGSFFAAGYYEYGASHNDFDPALNVGTANGSYAAHPFVVTGAEAADDITIRVTGTSINDLGVRVASDTDDIVIPQGTAANSYFEAKKFLGQVSIETVGGTAINCNYGWAKYWDNSNSAFTVRGLDCTWHSEANTSDSDVILRHHKTTGWTYQAGDVPLPPTALASMNGDHVTEVNTVSGQPGAWKRTNLDTDVDGAGSEGILIEIVGGAARAFVFGNFVLSITT